MVSGLQNDFMCVFFLPLFLFVCLNSFIPSQHFVLIVDIFQVLLLVSHLTKAANEMCRRHLPPSWRELAAGEAWAAGWSRCEVVTKPKKHLFLIISCSVVHFLCGQDTWSSASLLGRVHFATRFDTFSVYNVNMENDQCTRRWVVVHIHTTSHQFGLVQWISAFLSFSSLLTWEIPTEGITTAHEHV